MTDVLDPPVVLESHGDGHGHEEHHGPTGILKWMTSTDHKVIGLSYNRDRGDHEWSLVAPSPRSFARSSPPRTNTLVSLAQYNELFTMHGSVMIYLFVGPFAFGALANIIVPIQIGAPDMGLSTTERAELLGCT